MKISLAPVTDGDISELLEGLLPADRAEILALGHDPEWAIRNSVETSLECVAIRGDGRLACLTGVGKSAALDDAVYPWLLSTDMILLHPKHCLKMSKLILNRWLAVHPYMTNFVDVRHERAIRWLTWLGANLELVDQYGPFKRPFYKFSFGALPCA
jgi:hypothetical protein